MYRVLYNVTCDEIVLDQGHLENLYLMQNTLDALVGILPLLLHQFSGDGDPTLITLSTEHDIEGSIPPPNIEMRYGGPSDPVTTLRVWMEEMP